MIRGVLALVSGAIAVVALTATASAAKPQVISLDCGADGTMQIFINGNGQWTPGRIIGGGVIHPVAFSNQHSQFTDNQGNVFTEDPPDTAKAKAPANKTLVHCSFSVTVSDQNGSGTFSGEVDAFIVGTR